MKLRLADKEDKFNKVVKTAKSLKLKFETTKTEKEDLSKELEDAKSLLIQRQLIIIKPLCKS